MAPFPLKTKSILQYAALLTLSPFAVKEEHVEKLRKVGCSDREILDICEITSYFNYVNRMAHGLGVKLEKESK